MDWNEKTYKIQEFGLFSKNGVDFDWRRQTVATFVAHNAVEAMEIWGAEPRHQFRAETSQIAMSDEIIRGKCKYTANVVR